MQQIPKTIMFEITIVGPTGVPFKTAAIKPKSAQNTEIIAEKIVTFLKLLKIRIALIAGKITRAEIKSEPTRFIERTIIIAITTAITVLYAFEFKPDALEKS